MAVAARSATAARVNIMGAFVGMLLVTLVPVLCRGPVVELCYFEAPPLVHQSCPVSIAGEMCSKTQMLQTLRQARAAAAVKVKTNRGRLGALFVKNAQAARPNIHVVLGCARGCAEQLAERHKNWMSVMQTTRTAKDDNDRTPRNGDERGMNCMNACWS